MLRNKNSWEGLKCKNWANKNSNIIKLVTIIIIIIIIIIITMLSYLYHGIFNTLAYFMFEAYSKACQIFIMIRHIENRHFQAFSWTFSNIQPYSTILRNVKVGLSPSKIIYILYILQWKSFKNDEKCLYLFSEKLFSISICLNEYWYFKWYFVLNIWSCRKKGLIRKISLISKFMTSQLG